MRRTAATDRRLGRERYFVLSEAKGGDWLAEGGDHLAIKSQAGPMVHARRHGPAGPI